MNSPFTCITCQATFSDQEIQRQHYKSEWHRFNLRRKVAKLSSVSVEEFQSTEIVEKNKDGKKGEDEKVSCKVCRKSFNTRNQYENHLLSKKHKAKSTKRSVSSESANSSLSDRHGSSPDSLIKEATDEDTSITRTTEDTELDSDTESIDSDEWIKDTENPVKNNNCLFCNNHSKSVIRNLKHMTIAHSFFVPDLEYCTDIKGLLIYLGEKIYARCMCIWCNYTGKYFQSADAARAHMIDKGHCKMLHEGDALAEYTQFYDYSSSYPDADVHDPDAVVEIPELDDSDYQLVLPSGNIIDRRSLVRHNDQNLNRNRALAVPKSTKLRKLFSEYRALGWKETPKETVEKKARDIKYIGRVQAKYSIQLQTKANKLQNHFRSQIVF